MDFIVWVLPAEAVIGNEAPRWRQLRRWLQNLDAIALAAAEKLFSILAILPTNG
jgi:hypothetical protein